jgi:hypothetical protein
VLLLGLGLAFGRRFAWLLWAMCKSSYRSLTD